MEIDDEHQETNQLTGFYIIWGDNSTDWFL